jgi:hypothetical protein
MADGKNHIIAHDRMWGFAIIFGIIEAIIFNIWIKDFNLILFIVLYIFWYHIGERYISNDLDLDSMSAQEGRLLHLKSINIFMGLFGLIFMILSLCYSWVIPKHRHWLSHSIPLGTFIRCIWFIWLPMFFVFNWIGSFIGWTIKDYYFEFYCDWWLYPMLLSSFFALIFSDAIHLVMDSSFAKGRFYTPISSKKGK